MKRCARLIDVFLARRNELRRQKNESTMLSLKLGLSVSTHGITGSNAMRFKQTKCNCSVQINPSNEEGEEANSSSKTADMPDWSLMSSPRNTILALSRH